MDKNAIEKVIKDDIAPKLAADGGGIELLDVKDDNTVVVKLTGACGCCPCSTITLKVGVEAELKRNFPEIKEVVTG